MQTLYPASSRPRTNDKRPNEGASSTCCCSTCSRSRGSGDFWKDRRGVERRGFARDERPGWVSGEGLREAPLRTVRPREADGEPWAAQKVVQGGSRTQAAPKPGVQKGTPFGHSSNARKAVQFGSAAGAAALRGAEEDWRAASEAGHKRLRWKSTVAAMCCGGQSRADQAGNQAVTVASRAT